MGAKKISSYQKLKEENKKLNQDIYNIVMKRNEMIGVQTYISYKVKFQFIEQCWSGDSTSTDSKLKGIFQK